MTNLLERIKKDRIEAMKNKDTAKLSTLRMLLSEIENRMKKTGETEISDEGVQEVVSSQIKKLDKEAEAYVAVGQDTNKQEAEKAILMEYLPEQLTEAEIAYEINKALAMTERGDIKNPMAYLSVELKGKADMKTVSGLLKRLK